MTGLQIFVVLMLLVGAGLVLGARRFKFNVWKVLSVYEALVIVFLLVSMYQIMQKIKS